MGFKDYMLNTAFANQFISPLQGGLITAGEFAIGGFGMGLASGYAGGANSWGDAFKQAGIGAAVGAGLGFAAGYSYTAGWQSFLHGADTQAHNNAFFQRLQDMFSDLITEYGSVSVTFNAGTGIFGVSGQLTITADGVTGYVGGGWGVGFGVSFTGNANLGASSGWCLKASASGGQGPGAAMSGTMSQGGKSVDGGIGVGLGGGGTVTVGYKGEIISWKR